MSLDIDAFAVRWDDLVRLLASGSFDEALAKEGEKIVLGRDWLGRDTHQGVMTELWAWMRRDLPRKTVRRFESVFQGYCFSQIEDWAEPPLCDLGDLSEDEGIYISAAPNRVAGLAARWRDLDFDLLRGAFETHHNRRYDEEATTRKKNPRYEIIPPGELHFTRFESWDDYLLHFEAWGGILQLARDRDAGLVIAVG